MFLHFYFNDLQTSPVFRTLRQRYQGPVLAEGSLKPERYAAMMEDGVLQLTGFGRPFIANPDYVERLRQSLPLSRANPDTIYGLGAEGYTDYPAWNPADPAGSVVGLENPVSTNSLLKAEAQA